MCYFKIVLSAIIGLLFDFLLYSFHEIDKDGFINLN